MLLGSLCLQSSKVCGSCSYWNRLRLAPRKTIFSCCRNFVRNYLSTENGTSLEMVILIQICKKCANIILKVGENETTYPNVSVTSMIGLSLYYSSLRFFQQCVCMICNSILCSLPFYSYLIRSVFCPTAISEIISVAVEKL